MGGEAFELTGFLELVGELVPERVGGGKIRTRREKWQCYV
jgi:hypothetical protein